MDLISSALTPLESASSAKRPRRRRKTYGLCLLSLLGCLAPVLGDIATNPPPSKQQCFGYSHDVVSEIPWSIHIFKIRRNHPEFEFDTTSGNGSTLGMATVSEQLK